MGLVDRLLFRYVAVSLMRDQLLALMGRLQFIDFTAWGPGRVDTFEPPKALLGFRMDDVPPMQRTGIADFPSVWNQKARKGMWLHWDGNNCSVDERNLSAAFGTGATPVTLDRPAVLRIADFLWQEAQPLPFPRNRINQALASRGDADLQAVLSELSWHGARAVPNAGRRQSRRNRHSHRARSNRSVAPDFLFRRNGESTELALCRLSDGRR